MFDKVLSGKYVLSMMNYVVDECYYFKPLTRSAEECKKIYTSATGIITSPYFVIISQKVNVKAKKRFNNLLVSFNIVKLFNK